MQYDLPNKPELAAAMKAKRPAKMRTLIGGPPDAQKMFMVLRRADAAEMLRAGAPIKPAPAPVDIPPEFRTPPMTLQVAAKEFGFVGVGEKKVKLKSAAEGLRRAIDGGGYKAIQHGRQRWIFDTRDK